MSTSSGATMLDIVKAGLRRVASYQSGESIQGQDTQDCVDTMNDWLALMSNDDQLMPGVVEYITQWNAGQNTYNVGNPLCTEIGSPPFTATLVGGSNIMTVIGTVPANLKKGAWLTDAAGVIPTAVTNSTSYLNSNATPFPTTVVSISGNNVTMSSPASATPAGNDQITYTVPGDFLPAFVRPIMITSGFTRFSQLDFWLDIFESQEEYNAILYKPQPGPWPTVAWYNYAQPYSIFKCYQTPGNSSELHLFAKVSLSDLLPTQPVLLPPGYVHLLKWAAARLFWAEFVNPNTIPPGIEKMYKEAEAMIRETNRRPARRAMYDRELVRGNKADGGWIFHGGYR